MSNAELLQEIDRLKAQFPNADENKINALEGLIEQAAYEKIYLKELNQQALKSGLVEFHPDNPRLQRTLPISNEITKHSATLTNLMNQIMKHLSVEDDDWDDELSDYE